MTLKEEWEVAGSVLLRPITIIFLILALACLASPLYIADKNKEIISLLQILASLFSGISGGLVADKYKELTGNTILNKKGITSVRGLSLIRYKTRNIISVTKAGGNIHEIMNLVDLLEKDIANVSREWEDIIPGITKGIDDDYDVLSAKEQELEQALTAKAEIEARLIKEKESGEEITEELKKIKSDYQNQIISLKKQIASLESKTLSVSSAHHSFTSGPITLSLSQPSLHTTSYTEKRICSRCQKEYSTNGLIDMGVCPSCIKEDCKINL